MFAVAFLERVFRAALHAAAGEGALAGVVAPCELVFARLEHKGWKFSKPSPKEAAEIRRGVAEMKSGKVKTISSQDLIKHLEKL